MKNKPLYAYLIFNLKGVLAAQLHKVCFQQFAVGDLTTLVTEHFG